MLRRYVQMTLLLCVTLAVTALVFGQGERLLTPGVPVEGSVSEESPAQIYTFTVEAGATATVIATPQTNLALTILLSDVGGEPLGQVIGDGTENALSIEAVELVDGGPYYVTVFPTRGAGELDGGSFILTLELTGTGEDEAPTEEPTPEATTEPTPAPETDAPTTTTQFNPGQQVILTNGIEVDLNWDTTDDLNLQVRDPVGGTLFWDSRSTVDGGTFGADVNGLCELLTPPPVQETASWPGGTLLSGSYEVLVYYRQACEGNTPVDFTVNVTVDGETLDPIEGTLLPPTDDEANVFISSFTVGPEGNHRVGDAGPYLDTRVLDVSAEELLNMDATPVATGQTVQGLITNDAPYETYRYEGLAGDLISISMTAINGNLDTLLLVLDSAGNVIVGNDDVQPVVNTNSEISSLRLPADDAYTIVATRYGKLVGGTEGNYELAVTGSELPPELETFNLPSGDIEITVTWDTNADLQLLVRDPFGNAVYDDVPVVQSGGRLEAQGNINCTVSETQPPVSYIYWPEGFLRIGNYEIEVWYQSECNDTRPVTFNIYIVVENELIFTEAVPIQFNETYLTSFTVQDTVEQGIVGNPSFSGIIGGSETLNLNLPDELSGAVNVVTGQTVTGSITTENKYDLYTFDAEAGDLVTIGMVATSDTLDTQLFLIDPNGVEIAANDDSNETTNSLISDLQLSQDGQYVIVATHYGALFGGTTGGYNLTLRIDN